MPSREFLRANLAAGALTSTHFTVRTTMPLVLGVLGDAFRLGDGELGELGSAYSVGATLAAMTSVAWLSAADFRRQSATLLALGLLATAAVAAAVGYRTLLFAFVLAGVGYGGVYSLMIAQLAQRPDPNRSYGWQWSLGAIPGTLLLYLIPVSGAAASARGTVALLVAANLLMAVPILTLPRSLVTRSREPSALRGAVRVSRLLWFGLAGLFALYAGLTGAWAFLGRFAAQSGIGRSYSGASLAIAAAASSVSALVAAEIGPRGAGRGATCLVLAVVLGGFALLAFAPGRAGYACGTIVLVGFATYLLTFCTAITARLDRSGRTAGLPAGALGLGSIVGPAIAGHVYEASGVTAMFALCAGGVTLGVAGYLAVERHAR